MLRVGVSTKKTPGTSAQLILPSGSDPRRYQRECAHLYGLSREGFDHILGKFLLVFPVDKVGRSMRYALLNVYDSWAEQF